MLSFPDILGVSSSWELQEYWPDSKVVGHVVVYVLYPDDFEAVPVRPENVILSWEEGGALSDLFPSIQVLKPVWLNLIG